MSRSLIDQKRSILLPITLKHPVIGTANIKKKRTNGRNTCQIVMITATVFMDVLMRTTKRHKSMYSRYRNRNVRKSDRNASDDLLDTFGASSKRRKVPHKPHSRGAYGIDSDITTLKDKSNITHSVEFVKDALPKNMRIHEQSTISSNEPKSYMTGKSNVSKHTTETFQTSGERKTTQWDEFLSEEDSSCDDIW